jgi:hypothetical protein
LSDPYGVSAVTCSPRRQQYVSIEFETAVQSPLIVTTSYLQALRHDTSDYGEGCTKDYTDGADQ